MATPIVHKCGRSLKAAAVVVAAFLGCMLPVVRADAPAKPAATPAMEAQKLLTDLRKAGATADQKKEIVDRLLDLGDEGPRLLAAQCAKDYKVKSAAYLTKLEKGASDALKAGWKGKGNIEQEVAAQRKIVMDVSKTADLTKEMIHDKSDPAMAKLDALLAITPDGVFTAQPELKQQRQDLLDLASAWHRAVEKVPDDRRKSLSTAAAAPDPAEVEKDLAAKEELAAMMATPMNKPDHDVLLANRPLAEKLDPEEAKGILILNLMRVRLGIGACAIDPKLCEAGRGHSKDMKEKNFFAHESPVPGKETPWKRAQLAGTSANAENIFVGSESGAEAIKAWWYSPGHHKNMLGGHHRTGLGRYEKHWTQMFGA